MSKTIVVIICMMSVIAGCTFREIDYSFYDLSQVYVNVTSSDSVKIPDHLYVIFYNIKDSMTVENRYIDSLNPVFMPSGIYDVVLFNDSSPNNLFRSDSFANFQCYTELSVYNSFVATKSDIHNVIISPDKLWLGTVVEKEIFKPFTNVKNVIDIELTQIVNTYRFFIPVKGLDYLMGANGLVSGMAGIYSLADGALYDPPYSIILDIEKGEYYGIRGIWCSFNTFGVIKDMNQMLYMFDLQLPDGTSQSFEYDITELIENGEELVPETIVINYQDGQNGFSNPEISNWQDTSQTIILK